MFVEEFLVLGTLVDFGRDSDEEDQMVWYFRHPTLQEVNDLGCIWLHWQKICLSTGMAQGLTQLEVQRGKQSRTGLG